MNIQCSGDSRSFENEHWKRALKMRSIVASHWKLTMTNWDCIMKANPLPTIQEVVQELNIGHFTVVRHLKQIEKVKKLDRRVPHELTVNQKSHHFQVSSHILHKNKNHFSIGLGCGMKSGYYMTTGDEQLSDWAEVSSKAIPKVKLAFHKRPSLLFGDLLSVWSTTAFRIPAKHYIWEVCWENQWDILKIAVPSAGIDQQNGPNCQWQCPITGHTTNASKLN